MLVCGQDPDAELAVRSRGHAVIDLDHDLSAHLRQVPDVMLAGLASLQVILYSLLVAVQLVCILPN